MMKSGQIFGHLGNFVLNYKISDKNSVTYDQKKFWIKIHDLNLT